MSKEEHTYVVYLGFILAVGFQLWCKAGTKHLLQAKVDAQEVCDVLVIREREMCRRNVWKYLVLL